MKKTLLCLTLAIVFVCKSFAFTYDFKIGGIYYKIIGNGEVEVTCLGYSRLPHQDYSGSIVIPSTVTYNSTTYSVTSIGDYTFYGCHGLTSITIPNGVTSIGNAAFYNCGLTSITIPNGVTSIGDSVFYECFGLTSITIPNGVTSIGDRAFCDCYSLASITIPNSVTTIGDFAFNECRSLKSITIPNSVTSIGDYSFNKCYGLTSLTIGNSVTSIGAYVFSYCSGLTSVTIGNSVTSIGENAFGFCISLTSLTIPNSVTSIGVWAFYRCSGLTSITLPNSLISIGGSAFRECSSLTSITIPNSVTTIEGGTFNKCSSLKSVTIGNSVTYIGGHFLSYCDSLTEIICHAVTPPTIEPSTFITYDNIVLYVPANSITAYSTDSYWRNFFIQPIQGAKFSITVNANDNTMGTVAGGGTYKENSTAQLTAIPNSRYVFQRWNDGNTNNPRNVIVTQDSTFTAYFALLDNEHYTLEDQGVYYINGRIYNSQNMEIMLYYSDGRLISSSANDIEMSSFPSGIYVITDGKGGFLKINHYR